ncbi:hypothetical protein N2152v2_005299 [Parachlorella kessleri]
MAWVPFLVFCCLAAIQGSSGAASANIKPFSLADVKLLEGSEQRLNRDLNLRFLMMLEVDCLAYNFRLTAGLPTPGSSYGGWEDANVEVRGQFMGHYLTAMAYAYQNTGNDTYRHRAAQFVDALKEVQDKFGDGYLSAFPREHFDRLESLKPVWAPYYVADKRWVALLPLQIHKIMAGLLDQAQLAGHPQALHMVENMAHYFCSRIENLIAGQGRAHWEAVMENEFGGMNEVLYNLFMETGNRTYADCAHHFDKPSFYRPMVEGKDMLAGLHANTHLAQANGFGARFEATGDPEARAAVENFFAIVLGNHSFSTGGSNWYEHWYPPQTLGDALTSPDAALITEESCTQYNILKVARYLFRWTGDAALADYYERAILNDVIGVQRHPPASQEEAAGSHESAHHHHNHMHAHPHAHPHPHFHSHLHSHPHQHTHSRAMLHTREHSHNHLHPQQSDPSSSSSSSLAGQDQQGGATGVDAAAMSAAYAANPRPDNYQVVSWPDDPGRRFRGTTNLEFSPGQFIYYLPLGTGNSKGDQRGWTHGWGDPFHTFWCCYGSGVESMSKLADSIFFHRMPQQPSSLAAVGDLPSSPLGVAEQLPELFVNQLVSSELRWRELGVQLTMEADIYGPETAALVTLRLQLLDAGQARGAKRRFVLNWRVPSWMDPQDLKIFINGDEQDSCAKAARLAATATGTGPPKYGRGASYCSLGPDWSSGDVVEVEMPMRYRVEDLNDARREMRDLKAVMMGPLLMAGLTDDTRDLEADPEHIEDAIRLPDPHGLVSLEAGLTTGGSQPVVHYAQKPQKTPLLLHARAGGQVAAAPKEALLATRAAAMDATYRLVPGGDTADAPHQQQRVTLESMSRPGFYLCTDGRGGLMLCQPSQGNGQVLTFAKRDVGQGESAGPTLELEPLNSTEAPSRLAVPLGMGHDTEVALSELTIAVTGLRLGPPAAPKYPPGARLLKGNNRSYLLLPLGQIMDERYTAYFHFVKPSAQLERGDDGAGKDAAALEE